MLVWLPAAARPFLPLIQKFTSIKISFTSCLVMREWLASVPFQNLFVFHKMILFQSNYRQITEYLSFVCAAFKFCLFFLNFQSIFKIGPYKYLFIYLFCSTDVSFCHSKCQCLVRDAPLRGHKWHFRPKAATLRVKENEYSKRRRD